MKKLALLLLVLLIAPVIPVHAQGAWTSVDTNAQVSFGSSVVFTVRGTAPSPVQSLELYFQLEDELGVNRVEVSNPSSTNISAQWVWDLVPGELPPGQGITYWWRAHTSGGQELDTARASVPYEDARFVWQTRESGNIELYWYGQTSTETVDTMMQAAQQALQRLESNTGAQLRKPVRMYLYNSKLNMSEAIPSRTESYDQATVTLGIAMGGDTIVILATASGADSTVAHELSHIVVGQFTENPYGGLPTWLDEGLAMYAEGELRGANAADLQAAIRNNTLISIRSLSGYPGDPSKVDLFYGENYSVVNFLIEKYGADKMDALLKAFSQGMYQEDALQQVYGFGIDELEDQWRQAIGAAPRPTPAAEPAPVAPPSRDTGPSGITICPSAALVLLLVGAVGVWRWRVNAA